MANRYFGILFYSGPTLGSARTAPGWSEVYPISAADDTSAGNALITIAGDRLAMLTPDVLRTGVRLSNTDVKGDSIPVAISYGAPGTYTPISAPTCYNLDMALRLKILAGSLKRSARFIHAVPTDCVNSIGEFSGSATWFTVLNTYLGHLGSLVSIATKIPGALTPPFYTFTQITAEFYVGLERRAIGRPFGLRPGRRLVA
jgi:hypothetical protein